MMVIAALLVGACFAGCSMSQGSNSLLGNESSKESESYAEHLEKKKFPLPVILEQRKVLKLIKSQAKKRYIQRSALLCTMIKLSISNCAT